MHVTRLVVAQDCGPISNPDGMRNQIEGGALQGISRALGETVTWDEEKVTSIDWRTYRSLPRRLRHPCGSRSVLINQPDEEACGSGETADHRRRRGDRQRDLRRHRRPHPRGAVHA